ncbi:MAG: hypothetical protein KZQ83_19615 [gamma proteobacterium symbiont of Taylorina sp.]|nr:hypothetical protein [gamma proteobacterium symbiont of Taylorina sp.]
MTQIKTIFICTIFSLLMACGGGGARVDNTTTTVGQELMDLDESHKKGLLSESEYKKARKKIMSR